MIDLRTPRANAQVLLRELKERGYRGGYTLLKNHLQPTGPRPRAKSKAASATCGRASSSAAPAPPPGTFSWTAEVALPRVHGTTHRVVRELRVGEGSPKRSIAGAFFDFKPYRGEWGGGSDVEHECGVPGRLLRLSGAAVPVLRGDPGCGGV